MRQLVDGRAVDEPLVDAHGLAPSDDAPPRVVGGVGVVDLEHHGSTADEHVERGVPRGAEHHRLPHEQERHRQHHRFAVDHEADSPEALRADEPEAFAPVELLEGRGGVQTGHRWGGSSCGSA